MKRIKKIGFLVMTLLLATLLATPCVFADNSENKGHRSPESIVSCGAGNGEYISIAEVAEPISLEQCVSWEGRCAPCISSLENQGCKIIDVIVTHFEDVKTMTTYLLSCVKP
jgi:hypothetical protein